MQRRAVAVRDRRDRREARDRVAPDPCAREHDSPPIRILVLDRGSICVHGHLRQASSPLKKSRQSQVDVLGAGSMPENRVQACPACWTCRSILWRERPLGRIHRFVEAFGPRAGGNDADLGWRDFFNRLPGDGASACRLDQASGMATWLEGWIKDLGIRREAMSLWSIASPAGSFPGCQGCWGISDLCPSRLQLLHQQCRPRSILRHSPNPCCQRFRHGHAGYAHGCFRDRRRGWHLLVRERC